MTPVKILGRVRTTLHNVKAQLPVTSGAAWDITEALAHVMTAIHKLQLEEHGPR